MNDAINTHGLVVDFGRHRGELWTRVPVSYLKWVANSDDHKAAPIARAELDRRGTVTPTIEISGHAIDRASLSCRRQWHANRGHEEGLHAWLCRVGADAREVGESLGDGKFRHAGVRFVFEEGAAWPVLKTVMPG